jgi:hypothetical protein
MGNRIATKELVKKKVNKKRKTERLSSRIFLLNSKKYKT